MLSCESWNCARLASSGLIGQDTQWPLTVGANVSCIERKLRLGKSSVRKTIYGSRQRPIRQRPARQRSSTWHLPSPCDCSISTNRTGLGCFARTPENSLLCGHSVCDLCVRIFATENAQQPWTFSLSQCLLCQKSIETTFRLKPPTAGVRILSVDGRGIRGIVSLQWLLELESRLDLSNSLSDYFDFPLGISSGMHYQFRPGQLY